jgi:hypothetical protein
MRGKTNLYAPFLTGATRSSVAGAQTARRNSPISAQPEARLLDEAVDAHVAPRLGSTALSLP